MPFWKRQNYLLWISIGTAVMVLAMALLLVNQVVQKQAIQETARQRVDSVTNLVFYVEREALRLQREMAVQLASPEALDRDRLQLRYDIFLSGIAWLRESPSMRALAGRPQYAGVLPKLDNLLKAADAVFAKPQMERNALRDLLPQLDALQIDLMALSSAASSVESLQFETLAQRMLGQSNLILGLAVAQIVLLLLASVALVARQKRQVQEQQAMRALNVALRQERSNAEAANRAKSQFLANMSHELRTPFNGILGMLKILQSTGLDNRQKDYATKMERATSSLLALINDILDFSKVESGKLELHSQPFRLDRLLRDVSEILSAGAGSETLDVMYDVDPHVGDVLMGDSLKLQQVLINLGSNAIKFTAHGFVVIAIRRLESGVGHGTQVEFSVRDSGIGIAPEHQSHIFSAFSQAEASTTRQYGGTGLGLAICRRLVELMGGTLALQSAVGSGSVFSFVLALPVVAELSGVPSQEQQLPQAAKRVLVVDDNPVAQDILCRMTLSWGWPTTRADTGEEALAQLQDGHTTGQPFDLVLVDWHMPGMDGWELTRRIRQLALPADSPQPMVVMVTGTGRDRLAQRSQTDQALLDGLLVRPVTAAQLREAALGPGSTASRLRQGPRAQTAGARLSGMRILVVEDNPLNQQVAQELLEMEGALVVIAANGQLGVDAVATTKPPFDVVLMDLQMPVLDGYGATRAIRQTRDRVQLPIIAMTANAMDSDREACLAADMNEHIGKPFDMGRLVSLLMRVTGFRPPAADDATPAVSSLMQPDVPGLDLAGALERLSGVRPLYVRAAKDFSASLGTLFSDLRATLAAGDAGALRMQLHTLKGNAATLGATALSQHAAALEALHKAGFPAGPCAEMLAQLEPLAQAAQASLQQAIALLDAAKPTDGANAGNAVGDFPGGVPGEVPDTASALAGVSRLVALLKVSDMDALLCFAENRSALEALSEPFCQQLDEALQDLDMDKALALCSAQLVA